MRVAFHKAYLGKYKHSGFYCAHLYSGKIHCLCGIVLTQPLTTSNILIVIRFIIPT